MTDVGDGGVDAVFGVLMATGIYEAVRGRAWFRAGRLVRLQFGTQAGWEDPVGFTVFPDLGREVAAADGYVAARGVTRVYVGGRLDSEVDTGPVSVHTGRI